MKLSASTRTTEPMATMSASQTLVFVRHGETDFNSAAHSGAGVERLRGWIDVPLNAQGFAEAQRMAALLRTMPFARIYTSDLQRARDSATTIAAAVQTTQGREVPLIATDALRPWNAGRLQGQPVPDILPLMREYQFNRPTVAPPDGEPFAEFIQRYLDALHDLCDVARAEGPLAVVTHTRNLRAADAWFATGPVDHGLDSAIMASPHHLGTGQGLIYRWTDGQWKRDVLQPHSHPSVKAS